MKIWLTLWCLAVSPVLALAADFVYDDHGKRDPFTPMVTTSGTIITYDADLGVEDLNLEGIVSDPKGNSVAVINSKIVKTSDSIGPFQVVSIEGDHVNLSKEGQTFILKLKKGGT